MSNQKQTPANSSTNKLDSTASNALEQILQEVGVKSNLNTSTISTNSKVVDTKPAQKKIVRNKGFNEQKNASKNVAGKRRVLIDNRLIRILQFIYPDVPVSKTIERILQEQIEQHHQAFYNKVRKFLK